MCVVGRERWVESVSEGLLFLSVQPLFSALIPKIMAVVQALIAGDEVSSTQAMVGEGGG